MKNLLFAAVFSLFFFTPFAFAASDTLQDEHASGITADSVAKPFQFYRFRPSGGETFAENAQNEESRQDSAALEQAPPNTRPTGIRRGPAPTVSVNGREISVTLAQAQSMRITLFTPEGKKLARKRFPQENAVFKLPRSAKNEIIVQVEETAQGRFFSQRISVP